MGSGENISYYDALGIKRNASLDEIKTAYKKQCLSLHPDKNPYGEFLMRFINEAYEVLKDEVKRSTYDINGGADYRGGKHYNANGYRGHDPAMTAMLRDLKQQLADSERKRSSLKKKVVNLQEEVDVAQKELSVSKSQLCEKNNQNKQLQHKIRYSGQEQKRIQNEVDYLKSECDLFEQENHDHKRKMNVYEDKIEKTSRALREKKRKSIDELSRTEERARQKEVETIRVLSERSVCYRCNGEAAGSKDCTLCKGNGAVQGIWTRCHNCHGTGYFKSILGEEQGCALCSSNGAREGIHTVTCFKCGGKGAAKNDCNVCYKGKIRGFHLQPCPFCKGGKEEKCENCFGKAYISCRCGSSSCRGHDRNEVTKPASSLQRKLLALVSDEEQQQRGRDVDWSAKFLSRNWLSPI